MPTTRSTAAFLLMTAALLVACSNPDRDAEKAIVGVWNDDLMGVDFRADHSFSIASASGGVPAFKGSWSVKDKVLLWNTDDGKGKFADQILSVDDTTLVTKNAGTTHVRTRITQPEFQAIVARKPKSYAEELGATTPTPRISSKSSGVSSSAANIKFLEDSYYIPEKNVLRLPFRISRPATVHMTLETQGPVDVVVLSAEISLEDYGVITEHYKTGGMSQVMEQAINSLVENGKAPRSPKIEPTREALLSNPLSKAGAFGQRDVEAQLPAGEYAIFIDNSGMFTPTRGDVPVKIQMFSN